MPEQVTGSETKQRLFETPVSTRPGPDQVSLMDGPISGPSHITPAGYMAGALEQTPIFNDDDAAAAANAKVPIIYGPEGSQKTAMIDTAKLASPFYLGPKTEAPILDNQGNALKVGMVYYNTVNGVMYVFSQVGRWVEAGSALASALSLYVYQYAVDGTMCPPDGGGTPDSYGNILAFNIAAGASAKNQVCVYMNGALQVGQADYVLYEGGIEGDYIVFSRPVCATSTVMVLVFHSASAVFSPHSVKIDTSGWIYGEGNKDFPLVDFSGDPVIPQASTNMMVVNGSGIMQPEVDFTVNGSTVSFAESLDPDSDDVWIVVGLPTSGNDAESQALRTDAFSLTVDMNKQMIVCDGTFTVTVPSATSLGLVFSCELVVIDGTVTVDGPGATNKTVAAGNTARVWVAGSAIYCSSQAFTVLS